MFRSLVQKGDYPSESAIVTLAALLWRGHDATNTRKSEREALYLLHKLPREHMLSQSFLPLHDPHGRRGQSFLTSLLVLGDLKRNEASPLSRSFFQSPLREVHLLQIITDFLRPLRKEESERESGDVHRDYFQITDYEWNTTECSYRDLAFCDSLSRTVLEFGSVSNHDDNVFLRLLPLEEMKTLIVNSDVTFNLSCFSHIPSLFTSISLSGLMLRDVSHLGTLSLSHLKQLVLTKTDVFDLSFLSPLSLPMLEELLIDLSPLKSISFLSSFSGGTKLKKLKVSHTNVSDFSPLSLMDASCLEELDLSHSLLSSLSPLESLDMPHLTYLLLSESLVDDIGALPLMKAESLSGIDLSCTPLSDLSPFSSFRGSALTTLLLHCSLVEDVTPLEGVEGIGQCRVNLKEAPASFLSPTPPSWMSKAVWGRM